MRQALWVVLAGCLIASMSLAAPRNPHRLQVILKADAFTPDFVDVLKRRVTTYVAFRALGDALVYQPEKGASKVIVELPIKRGEVRRSGRLLAALEALLTRSGSLEFTWDAGHTSLKALQALQSDIGAGWVDEHESPHARFPEEVSLEVLQKAVERVPAVAGTRWVIEALVPKTRKSGSEHVVYAALKTAVLTNTDIASVSLQKTAYRRAGLMVHFDKNGSEVFASSTKRHVGQRLIILFEGAVISAPVVRESITGGRALLDLGKTGPRSEHVRKLQEFAAAMSADALVTPVRLVGAQVLDPIVEESSPQ